MAVPVEVELSSSLQVGSADLLFQRPSIVSNDLRQFDLSPDGKRFVVLANPGTTADTDIEPEAILVKNWFEELTRLVPTP